MIDHHAHPFDVEPGPFDLQRLAVDVEELEGRGRPCHCAPPLWRALLRARLARHLGVDERDLDAARAEAAADYGRYVRSLFADAGVEAMLLDPSWPPGAAELLDRFAQLSGASVHPLVRVDTVIDASLDEDLGFDELVARFDAALEQGRASGARGLKSIAAYRTGLRVDIVSEREARTSCGDGAPVRRRAKPLRDWLFRRALAYAAEHDLPVQVHTGFGDGDLRLAEANPVLLDDVLRTPEGAAARVVLLHGAFPFVDEAAFLAAAKPNVHVDLSLVNVFAPPAVADCLLRLVSLAPPDRILVGTDGYALPEAFWFAALVLRDAWHTTATRLREAGLPNGWIAAVEDGVFGENARRLYGLA